MLVQQFENYLDGRSLQKLKTSQAHASTSRGEKKVCTGVFEVSLLRQGATRKQMKELLNEKLERHFFPLSSVFSPPSLAPSHTQIGRGGGSKENERGIVTQC